MIADLQAEGIVTRIDGPLLFARRQVNVGLNEAVRVTGADGRRRLGRIAALDDDFMVVEVLESTDGLSLAETSLHFLGSEISFALGPGILGRVFDGVGRVLDEGPPIPAQTVMPINGSAINPVRRAKPEDFIETGVSTIDILNSLVRGQKLPIFSGGGLPHNRLALMIALHARLRRRDGAGEGHGGAGGGVERAHAARQGGG
ncbi:MAG: V-type ATP synthase subunit B, partial [Magnetococcales bacterium]|nr:V-type ATP synthase subunit B [Magnetococcales bacterium]